MQSSAGTNAENVTQRQHTLRVINNNGVVRNHLGFSNTNITRSTCSYGPCNIAIGLNKCQCGYASYCSDKCKAIDWTRHKDLCFVPCKRNHVLIQQVQKPLVTHHIPKDTRVTCKEVEMCKETNCKNVRINQMNQENNAMNKELHEERKIRLALEDRLKSKDEEKNELVTKLNRLEEKFKVERRQYDANIRHCEALLIEEEEKKEMHKTKIRKLSDKKKSLQMKNKKIADEHEKLKKENAKIINEYEALLKTWKTSLEENENLKEASKVLKQNAEMKLKSYENLSESEKMSKKRKSKSLSDDKEDMMDETDELQKKLKTFSSFEQLTDFHSQEEDSSSSKSQFRKGYENVQRDSGVAIDQNESNSSKKENEEMNESSRTAEKSNYKNIIKKESNRQT